MIKTLRLALTLLVTSAISAFACQADPLVITSLCHIAGANFFQPLITEIAFNNYVEHGQSSNVDNTHKVSLPLTMWFKVGDSTYEVDGVETTERIYQTKLFYKIIPSGADDNNPTSKWRLLRSINTENIDMNYDSLVKLFGHVTLSIPTILRNGDTINKNDKIIFVWYFVDELGLRNAPLISAGSNAPAFNVPNSVPITYVYNGNNGFPARYVMKVTYNGMKTP
jgi:hypothetical protein